MRYFFDTEFYDDGKRIQFISIGIVSEDGREYYAESSEFDWDQLPADHWLQTNVRPHLTGPSKPNDTIAAEIAAFVGKGPEFWAYFAAHDWVVMCNLYGGFLEVPYTWPHLAMDLAQAAKLIGVKYFPEQTSTEHNALEDARHNIVRYNTLLKYTDERTNRG